ncbi:MAG TPA: beta-glucoside-specific PTS transporter subunit IIABC [Erysipelothrix sp.]|nr:beta-glucoside-specific PTS transporter subunit IIABC [Erysipelothrix sp.]
MGKYNELVNQIVRNVGGKENIAQVRHCVTRLRFNLVDDTAANEEAVKNIDGVVTVVKGAGQFQVVIGNHVPDVYKEVLEVTGIQNQEIRSAQKISFKDRAFDLVTGMLLPSISILSASGIIKGIAAILVATNLVAGDSSVYTLLDGIGSAMMFFFPVFVGLNTSRKLGMNENIGLAIGVILTLPALNGVDLVFFGHTFNVTYTETVLPAFLIVLMAAPLEKFFNKIIPDVVKSFITPVFVLLISIPIGFLLIGPFANLVSLFLSDLVQKLIAFSPVVAGFVSGAFWQLFVLFGVHIMILIPSITNLMGGIPDQFIAFITVVSFSQMAVVLAIWIKSKNKKLREIALPAWISGIFGVTEPAIYGVTLPRIKYFFVSMIGGAIGGALVGLFDIVAYNMTGMGVFALAGFIPLEGGFRNIGYMLIAVAVSFLVGFVLTMMMYKDEGDDLVVEMTTPKLNNEKIQSPLVGELDKLENSKDDAFATGALGKGVIVTPKEGKLYAPFSGTVTVLFPTLHAIGMISDNGTEVLIHVGIDTVNLDGEHFKSYIQQGDVVKHGDLLLEFDIEAIQNDGYSIETPIVITNTGDYLDILVEEKQEVNTNDTIITALMR